MSKRDYGRRSGISKPALEMMKGYYVEDDEGLWVLMRERGVLDPVFFMNGGTAADANVEWVEHEGGRRCATSRSARS